MIEKLNKVKRQFLEKTQISLEKNLKHTEISIIRNKRDIITAETIDMRRIIREYYE